MSRTIGVKNSEARSGGSSIVWWLKQEHEGAWALLLFCSALTYQLANSVQADLIPWFYPRMWLNTPMIGAVTFHLFTTYPVEPDWIVRHRRIQLVPYGLALGLICITLLEVPLGLPPGVGSTLSLLYVTGLFVTSLGIVWRERRRIGDGALRDRADVMFLGAAVSFLPVLAVLMFEWLTQAPFPYYVALLWVFLFPVAVG